MLFFSKTFQPRINKTGSPPKEDETKNGGKNKQRKWKNAGERSEEISKKVQRNYFLKGITNFDLLNPHRFGCRFLLLFTCL